MSGFVVLQLVCVLLVVGLRLPEVLGADETPRQDRRPNGAEPVTLSPEEIRQRQDRERSKQRYLYQTLKNVLHGTTLMTRPNVTGNGMSKSDLETIKHRMEESLDEEEKQNRQLANNGQIRRIQTILPSCGPLGRLSNRSRPQNNEFRLFFKVMPQEISQRSDRVKVISANLALKRKPMSERPGGKGVNRNRNKKRKNGNSSSGHLANWTVRIRINKQHEGKRVVKTVPLGAWNSTGWMKIDIVKAVENWYKAPNQNTGLEVTVLDGKKKPVSPFQVFEDNSCTASEPRRKGKPGAEGTAQPGAVNNQQRNITSYPYLEIVTTVLQRTHDKRRQRHLPRSCRMTRTYIKFADYEPQWRDRVLSPEGFTTGICRGTCPKCHHSQPTTANSTRNLLQNETNGCCRPIRTSSLPILLVDDDSTIRYTTVENLIVKKCGCPL